jgi:hypothetical protein
MPCNIPGNIAWGKSPPITTPECSHVVPSSLAVACPKGPWNKSNEYTPRGHRTGMEAKLTPGFAEITAAIDELDRWQRVTLPCGARRAE